MSKTDAKSKTAANGFSRREALKLTAAAGAGIAMPALISPSVLASSGEINIMMWSDYLPESFVKAFTAQSGIKVNFTGIGSNDDILNKMKATNGQGFDIVTPTVNRSPLWADLGLLQPFDMKKVAIDKVNPAMALGDKHWNFGGKGSCWLPHLWAPRALPGAPTSSRRPARRRAITTSGTMPTPARPCAGDRR